MRRLFAPVDVASLVFFRVAFGALLLVEVVRYFMEDWIGAYWIEPRFHFTYLGFDWVRPWPGPGMYLHFAGLGVLALLIAAGAFYRASAALFALGFTYVFLLEQARYLNHFYLICLLGLLLVFVPAHRAFSVDAWRWPEWRSDTVPAWSLWLLRAQLGIVYFYAGVAKLNADWLQGEPSRSWLAGQTQRPLIGRFVREAWFVGVVTYGGLVFDLTIPFLLLWKRTRPWAFAAAVVFHLSNAMLFRIGIFPWLMLAATALFFEPDWPRRLWRRFGRQPAAPPSTGTEAALPALDRRRRLVVGAMAVYLAVQLLVPLRHFLYPGSVHWTEEGHYFAWHMKLRDKDAAALEILAFDPAGENTYRIDLDKHLTRWQQKRMCVKPDMLLLFCHHVAREMGRAGYGRIEVRARARASLNGREPQFLVDPKVDLASRPRSLWPPADWILPLTEPLPSRAATEAPPFDVDD